METIAPAIATYAKRQMRKNYHAIYASIKINQKTRFHVAIASTAIGATSNEANHQQDGPRKHTAWFINAADAERHAQEG